MCESCAMDGMEEELQQVKKKLNESQALYNILKVEFEDLAKEHNEKMDSCRVLQHKHKKLVADIKVWMDRLQSDAHLINYTHEMLYSTLHTLLFAIGEQ